MKKIIFVLLTVLFISCSEKEKHSIKLGVNQTVKIPVEYVSISAGIQLENSDAATAEKNGYQKLNKAVGLLQELGYKKEQLEINSGEVINRSYNDRTSYRFESTIDFDIMDLDQIDSIRRALIKEGVNNFSITSYENSNEDSLYNQAYQQAIGKAKEKAQQLLNNQQRTIGEILNLSENVEETVEIAVTAQQAKRVPINLDADMALSPVPPLFQKKDYQKTIDFAIEFALN